jgi:Spy/CpxP family protein refolding chaperone
VNAKLNLTRIVLLALVSSAGAAVAHESLALDETDSPRAWQGHGHHHGGNHGDSGFGIGMSGGFGPALKQLNLTDEQRKSVESILSAARPEMQKMRTDMRNMVETFQNTLPDDPKYSAAIVHVTKESQQLAAALVKQVSEVRQEIYAVLTPEQKAKLPDLMKKVSTERG